MRKVLTDIGRKNQVLSEDETFDRKFMAELEQAEQSNDEDKGKKDASVKEFVADSTNVKNLCAFVMTAITTSCCYYLMNFYSKYLPGSIFVNNSANSIADSLGGLAAIVCLRG